MRWSMLLLAVLACTADDASRSVRVVSSPDEPSFQPAQFAGLFVGVREFPGLADVRYAADDAVDLAYAFSGLIDPSRMALAISHDPLKESSQKHLRELMDRGAQRVTLTTRDSISQLLEQRAGVAGPNGFLVVSFATHGFNRDGNSYLLASDSRFQDPEASLSTSRVLEVAAHAGRSLVILDACRERVDPTDRAVQVRPSPASMIRAVKSVHGQAVIAAAPGQVVFDNPARRNGILTYAILEGMRCKAKTNGHGMITVDTLHPYVEKYVKRWLRQNRDRRVTAATQLRVDGSAGAMPLAECAACQVTDLSSWKPPFDTRITQAEVADLDGDGRNEVIAATGDEIHAYGCDGRRLWSRIMKAPIRKFAVAGGYVVPIAREHLTILDARGERRSCSPAGGLHEVVIDRETSRHQRKVIVAGINDRRIVLAMVDPKKCTTLWRRAISVPGTYIEKLETGDVDNDGRRDITLTTSRGTAVLNFDGETINNDIDVVPIPKKSVSVSSN